MAARPLPRWRHARGPAHAAGVDPEGRRIITFGTFDLFHVGHVNVLRRARGLGDWLIVGISSDELNARKRAAGPTSASTSAW